MSQFQRTGLPEQATPIPSSVLYAGITQQPGMTRFPNQVSDAANADFSTFDGATKRVGTEVDRRLSLTAAGVYRLHAIDRDDTERYVALVGPNGADNAIRVYKRGSGTAGTVNLGTGVQTYLNSGSATARDLKLVTINDTTLIINTKVATGTLNFTNYTVTATWDDADAMTAQTPAVNTYHRARADGVDFAKGYYQYVSTDSRTYPTYFAKIYAYTDWWKLNGDWDSSGSDPKKFRMAFRRMPLSVAAITSTLVSGDRWKLTKAGLGTSCASVLAGEHVRVTGGTGLTFGGGASSGFVTFVEIDSGDPTNSIIVTDATSGPAYRAGTSVAMAAAADVAIDGVGKEYEISITFSSLVATYDSMSDIAARIQQEFRSLGENAVLVAWVPSLYTNGAFQVTGPWKGNDAIIYPPLPPLSGAGGSGDLTVSTRPFSATAADYTIAAGGGGSGAVRVDVVDRWVRVPSPAELRYDLDPTKMPVKMVRTSVSPLTFDVSQIAWDDRPVGDEETNDIPQPFKDGEVINDAALYKNRLVFGMGRWVVASESGNLFNFYRTAEDQVVDSDRITLELSGDQLPTIYSLFSYREKLLVLTQPEQVYEVGGDAFTPTQATVTRGPRHSAVACAPVSMDQRVYFPSNRLAGSTGSTRQTAQVREYVYDDAFAQSYATDITAHVPSLVEANITRMVAVPSEGWLATVVGDAELFYVYRTAYEGNQKIQSAWTKYLFDSIYRIVDMVALRNEVWMLVERVTRDSNRNITASSGEYLLEVLRVQPDAGESLIGVSSVGRQTRLDRRISRTGSYSAPTTTWTLADQYGNTFSDSTYNKVILADGTLIDVTTGGGGSTVTATGDYSSGAVTIGRSYNMALYFTEAFTRFQGGLPALGKRPTTQVLHVRTRRSGDFSIDRVYTGNRLVRNSFSPVGGFLETEQTFKVFQLGPAGSYKLSLGSGSRHPVNITAIEFDTNVTSIQEKAVI